jgi:hypothetical protein
MMEIVTAKIGANSVIRDRVEPHAAALESCAASMEAAGIGGGFARPRRNSEAYGGVHAG